MRLEDAKQIEQLEVYKGAKLAGTLTRVQKGCVFAFDQGYVSENNKGIAFHISTDTMTHASFGDALPPFFAGLLPEGLRLNALVKKIKTSEDDLFSILAMVGKECIGIISIATSFSIPEKSVSLMLDKFIKVLEQQHPILFSFMSEKQKALWIKMFNKRHDDLKA